MSRRLHESLVPLSDTSRRNRLVPQTGDASLNRSHERAEGQLEVRLGVLPLRSKGRRSQEEAASIVKPIADKLLDEKLVSASVRRIDELREHLEVWLAHANRGGGRVAIIEQHEISEPRRGDGLKAPSRYDAQRSVALPIASSVRLLKLFPNEGPVCDLNFIAAIRWPSWMTTRSHFFSERNQPGSSSLHSK